MTETAESGAETLSNTFRSLKPSVPTRSLSEAQSAACSGRRSSTASLESVKQRRSSWVVVQDAANVISFSNGLKTLRDTSSMTVDYHIHLEHRKTIAAGAFGVVEQCMYLPLHRNVAVKKLKLQGKLSKADIEDMMREIALMKKLRSPFIVEFIGSGHYLDQMKNDVHFLVEEFVDGGTLKGMVSACLRSGKLLYSMQDALRWLTDVAKGLQYLHESIPMVIHRDMKLENVLLEGTDPHTSRAKICDLGLSAMVRRDSLSVPPALLAAAAGPRADKRTRRTSTVLVQEWSELAKSRSHIKDKPKPKAGQLKVHGEGDRLEGRIGTWLYMAPEVYRQEAYDEKADVFSFGIIAYEVLHRYRMAMAVADAEEAQVYARRVATREYRPPVDDLIPVQCKHILQQCWHPLSQCRPSMATVVKELREAGTYADWGPYDRAAMERERQRERAQATCGCCVS